MSFEKRAVDEFTRLHRMFVFHLGCAVTLSWVAAIYAASQGPWVRNIRALIDPTRPFHTESTWSFVFGLPMILTIGWISVFFGADVLRRIRTLRSQSAEFALAGGAAFMVFYMAIDRAVTVVLLGIA